MPYVRVANTVVAEILGTGGTVLQAKILRSTEHARNPTFDHQIIIQLELAPNLWPKHEMEKLFLVPFRSAHKSNLIKLSPQLKNIQLKMTPTPDLKLPIVADESIMSPKAHGTSHTPVQSDLRWNCKNELADR